MKLSDLFDQPRYDRSQLGKKIETRLDGVYLFERFDNHLEIDGQLFCFNPIKFLPRLVDFLSEQSSLPADLKKIDSLERENHRLSSLDSEVTRLTKLPVREYSTAMRQMVELRLGEILGLSGVYGIKSGDYLLQSWRADAAESKK